MAVCPKTLDVLVQLEGSGRWPENSAAINKTKAGRCNLAFLRV
jgi:U3 small nucleolar RNA-associated protein 22